MTNRWPPQPGDLVKVERATFDPTDAMRAMIGGIFSIEMVGHCMADINGWTFNLSDLSPATPPQTIEQYGRTYRLVEECGSDKIEAAIDAVLKARNWRDRMWRDLAIGMFQYGGENGEPVRHVVRDHEAEQEQGKTVVLFSGSDREECDREYQRAIVRRELRAALAAMSNTTEPTP